MSTNESVRWLRAAKDESTRKTKLATEFYNMLKKHGKLKAHRVVTYFCPNRCRLADVLDTKQGLIIHSPGYKLSPRINEGTTNASGRAANTIDGNRRWKAHTYFIDQAANITCSCDHVRAAILEIDRVRTDVAAGRAEITIKH